MVVGTSATALAAGMGYSLGGVTAVFGVLGVAMAAVTLFAPQVVALLGLAAFYLNLPGIAVTVHGVPSALAAAAFLLFLAPFLVRVLLGREAVIVDRPLVLIVAFLGAVLLSTFLVQDRPASNTWLTTFLVEGLLMYFLALNLFRNLGGLRRALDVLMVCGALLGGLTVYQEASRSFTQQFSGLAQRNIDYGASDEDFMIKDRNKVRSEDKIHLVERAGGPLGKPNRYAQIMVMLLPLVYFRMRGHKRLSLKLFCAVCGALILAGALLTYSRGGFLGIGAVLAVLIWMGGIRLKELGLFACAAVLAVVAFLPTYVERLGTLKGVEGVVAEEKSDEADEVFAGRLTEMLAALNVFLDHPVLGVGPGQFLPVYSQNYMNNPDVALRRITIDRRAHCLYFELAAETGILGIALFLGAVGLIMSRLLRAWRRWRQTRPDLAGLAGGFFLGLVGYLATAIFLSLAYQRYYWLFLGLAGAALQALSQEERWAAQDSALEESPVSPVTPHRPRRERTAPYSPARPARADTG